MDEADRRDEEIYENIRNNETCALQFLDASRRDTPLYDSRSVPRIVAQVSPRRRRRYNNYKRQQYIETTLMNEPLDGLRSYSRSSSSSANSLDNLCQKNQHLPGDTSSCDATNAHDYYMIPTRDPRQLNERILSLFNPQFLPNFNDMIMYVATQYDSRRSSPPRSRSMIEGDGYFFRNSSYKRKRGGTNSMFFRRGLTYDIHK